ncbi:MAG: hypothetical protein R2911_00755 [Caldilineaceae bacterium]
MHHTPFPLLALPARTQKKPPPTAKAVAADPPSLANTVGALAQLFAAQFPGLAPSDTQLASAIIWLPGRDGRPFCLHHYRGKIAQTTAQVTMAASDDSARGPASPRHPRQ